MIKELELLILDYLTYIGKQVTVDETNTEYINLESRVKRVKEKVSKSKMPTSNSVEETRNELTSQLKEYKGSKILWSRFVKFLAEKNKTGKITLNKQINILTELNKMVRTNRSSYDAIDSALQTVLTREIDNINYLIKVAEGKFKETTKPQTPKESNYLELLHGKEVSG